MKSGIELIAIERQEQIEKHGYDHLHDDAGQPGELRKAAVWLLTGDDIYYPQTWSRLFYEKMMDKKRKLTITEFIVESNKIAAALLAADIDIIHPENEKRKFKYS